MLLHYLAIAFRAIRRNRLYSFLNIAGLALGVAAFLFIVQYVSYEKSYDRFNKNFDNLYRIAYRYSYFKDGSVANSAAIPPRIAPFMKETMPEVKAFARVRPYPGVVISYDQKKIRQDRVLFVDSDFLKIFTYPMLEGNVDNVLNDLNSVVITESMAKKYFGDRSPLGKTLGVDGIESYKITGVVKDAPTNSHLKFDFLISYKTIDYWTEGDAEKSWWFDDYYSYVLLDPSTDIQAFHNRFSSAFEKERGASNKEENSKQEFYLQPIGAIHLFSKLDKEPEPEKQGDSNSVTFVLIIAFSILLISWINYINLFTARALERAKEVGVRKTVGAFKSQLVAQFLIESLLMNSIALTIGLVIAIVGIPYFNVITNSLLTTDFLFETDFWVKLIILLMTGSLVAGLYPAFVLSSYKPVVVLKGNVATGGSAIFLRRALVVFQFAASIILIVGTIVVYQQLEFMQTTDLGFDQSEVMVIRGPGIREDEIESPLINRNDAFINTLLSYPEVKSVTGGSVVPGMEVLGGVVMKRKEDPESSFKFFQNAWIGYDYFSTLNVNLLAGRTFSREILSDSNSLVINRSALNALGYSSPEEAVNQKISFGVVQVWKVIGVVEDFNQVALHEKVRPRAFMMYAKYSPFYIVRFEKGTYQSLMEKSKQQYEAFFPRDPFDYFFLDEFFNLQYRSERQFSSLVTIFATFAILVSCLGLFGLSSFTLVRRTKEIGIRKILGANIAGITLMLSKEFILLIAIANMIAWPLAFVVMGKWLETFVTRITIGPAIFITSGVLVMIIALLTVGYKTIRTASADPVKALRYE